MERLTFDDLNKVCYDPWELCGMDSYCKKGCHEEGGCTKNCHILKMYRKLAEYEDMEEQGLIAQCTCKDCNKGDWSGCKEGTVYCMEHGAYFSWEDFCNKAEKDDE